MTKILLVDAGDEQTVAAAFIGPLKDAGYDVDRCGRGDLERQPDASLIIASFAIAYQLAGHAGLAPVVATQSHAPLRESVELMRLGIADILPQPFDTNELLATVERHVSGLAEVARSHAAEDAPMPGMIGLCASMRGLFSQIRKVAPVESTVLIQGESGTGKELVARALHTLSTRADQSLISLNCAAIPEPLIESELFGHERGAFSGASQARRGLVEAADGGTLFLDEIGELPPEAQARLLRVLQDGEIRRVGSVSTERVDIRLVAATHRDLRRLTETGQFREDLFYRLNVVTLALPPLRERAGDIDALCDEILRKTCQKLNKPMEGFEADAIASIHSYHWPGNVRELENAIERAVILSDNGARLLHRDLLAIDTTATRRALSPEPEDASAGHATLNNGATTLDDYFIQFVQDNQDSMTETELAQRLGISRKSLWERRQRFSIPRRKTKKRGVRSAQKSDL